MVLNFEELRKALDTYLCVLYFNNILSAFFGCLFTFAQIINHCVLRATALFEH